jgi:rubrerythrin
MNRRTFLQASTIFAPAAVAAQATGLPLALAQSSPFGSDVDVLNYALVAEYFLSQFYREARVKLRGKEARYIQAIGADEDAHIAAITQTIQNLGGSPVQAPAIDYKNALSSRENLLRFALRFENLFARAYLGAAAFVKSPDILQAAAGIFGVEERHAAIVANLLGRPARGGVYVGAADTPAGKTEVLGALKPYLGGAGTATDGAAVTK